MSLAYQNSGDFAKAIYGEQQHAGPSGSIAMAIPSAHLALNGGSRKNKSNKNNKNQKDKKEKNQKKGGNKSKKNNKSQRNKNKNQKNKKN